MKAMAVILNDAGINPGVLANAKKINVLLTDFVNGSVDILFLSAKIQQCEEKVANSVGGRTIPKYLALALEKHRRISIYGKMG